MTIAGVFRLSSFDQSIVHAWQAGIQQWYRVINDGISDFIVEVDGVGSQVVAGCSVDLRGAHFKVLRGAGTAVGRYELIG